MSCGCCGKRGRNMSRNLRNFGWALLYTILFVFIQMGVTFLAAIAYIIWEITADHVPIQCVRGLIGPVIMSHAVFLTIVGDVIIVALAVIVVKSKRKRFRRSLHISTEPPMSFILPVITAFLYSAAANILIGVVKLPDFLQSGAGNLAAQMESSNTVLNLIAVLIVAPIAEEIIFRGVIMTTLRRSFSSAMTIFLSALLFSLTHLMTGSILVVLFTFFGGLICALVYEKTGSLTIAIVAHIFLNVGGLASGLAGRLPVIAQYTFGAVAIIIAVILFILLAKKQSKLKINIFIK